MTSSLPLTDPLPSTLDYATPTTRQASRLLSLDVFRGITIAGMLLVNNPGKGEPYGPLEHAPWHGWTPTDLIFPFFLFIVGVAIPFSQAKRTSDQGQSRKTMLAKIWLRALSLFMLGELLTGLPFSNIAPAPDGFILLKMVRVISWIWVTAAIIALLVPWKWPRVSLWLPIGVTVAFYLWLFIIAWVNRRAVDNGLPGGWDFAFGNGVLRPDRLRIPGVLQRIGICYGVAATIALFAGWKTVLASAVVFMAAYSALMLKVPYHDHVTGSLTAQDNLARRIDEDVFNRLGKHTYGAYPDPEGLLSSLPAIGSVLIGILVGYWLKSDRPVLDRCTGLLAMGVIVATLGVCLGWWLMPINKQIWTPSFTVFTAGMGMLGLGLMFWIIDVHQHKRWALPFTIYGMNAIAAFVVAGLVVRVGSLIKFQDPETKNSVTLLAQLRDRAADGVGHLSAALHWPGLNTPGNTALAYSLGFVLAILVLMTILYVFKIFVKV